MAGAPRGTREERKKFWASHVEGWKQSGVSKRKYCELQSLPLHTFSKWSKNLLGGERTPTQGIELVHLGPLRPTAAAPIAVVLGGGRYRVELLDGFRAATLREVIDALEVR
jgi:hypothetical protein